MSKSLIVLSSSVLIFLLISINYFFGISNIWWIDYPAGIVILLCYPILIGKLSISLLYKSMDKNKNNPIWVLFPIFWCIGNIILNIPAVLTHITKIDFQIWNLLLIFILTIFYYLSKNIDFESISKMQENPIWKIENNSEIVKNENNIYISSNNILN